MFIVHDMVVHYCCMGWMNMIYLVWDIIIFYCMLGRVHNLFARRYTWVVMGMHPNNSFLNRRFTNYYIIKKGDMY